MKKIVGISLIAALFIFSACKKNAAPTCSIIVPVEGEEIAKGSIYTLMSEADDPDGNLASVGFFINNIGVDSPDKIIYSYDWDTDEVNVGSHSIAVVALDDEGERSTTYHNIMIIDLLPETDFVTENVAVMVGDTVIFTDLTLNYPIAWSWQFGDGDNSEEQNPKKTYAESGIYSVSLTTTNTSGSDIEAKTDYIVVSQTGEAPVAGFSVDEEIIEEGTTVNFTDLSANSPTSWSWDFGDGGTSAGQNPSYTFNSPGVYTIQLTASNNYGSTTEIKEGFITVNESDIIPVAHFVANQTMINIGDTVIFADSSANSPTSWTWDFGDGGSSSVQSPEYIYSSPGTFSVSLVVSNDAGSDSKTITDFITVSSGSIPTADFMADQTSINVGDTVNFTDSSTNSPTDWFWDFGDGNTSTEQSPTYVYFAPGVFSVSLTASNNVGSDTKTIIDYISVQGLVPVTDFTADATIAILGDTINFTDLSSNAPTSWLWNFGDGNSSNEQNPSYEYTITGSFTVSLTTSNTSGTDSEIKTSYISISNALPEADFSADQTVIEEGNTVNFTDLSTNYPNTWIWDFGDGGSSSGQNPSYTFVTPGTYTVSLTASNNAGSNTEIKTDYIVVNVLNNIPVTDFTADPTTINVDNEISFTDLSSNAPTSWLWNFGDGETSTDQNPVHSYTVSGVYSISLTSANNYGSSSETKTDYITITAIPEADFSADQTTIMAGESVQFTDLSTNSPTSWLWDFGDGTSQGQNPIFTFNTPGVYTVTLTVTNSFGSDIESKTNYIVVN